MFVERAYMASAHALGYGSAAETNPPMDANFTEGYMMADSSTGNALDLIELTADICRTPK